MKQLVLIIVVLVSGQAVAQKRATEFARIMVEANIQHDFKGFSDWTPAIDYRAGFMVDDVSLKDGRITFQNMLGYRLLKVPNHFDVWIYPFRLMVELNEMQITNAYNLTLRFADTQFFKAGIECNFFNNMASPAVYFAFTPLQKKTKGGQKKE
jgi:hypothetical protein